MAELEKNETLEKLESIDFSKDTINIDEAFDAIKDFKAEYESAKSLEAENLIEELAPKYLVDGFAEKFMQEKENLRNYIRKFDPNLEEVKKMKSEEIDKVYKVANYIFNVWQMKLNEMEANFDLTREEWSMISTALNHKIEFDVNEAINLADLKINWMNGAEKAAKASGLKVGTLIKTKITIAKCVILYHLISKYKVKGSGETFNSLISVISKIGDINKLFNAFNVVKERLSSEFTVWGGNLEIEQSPAPVEAPQSDVV